ncbi:hypothetical protein, partial [Endothiovibrio diazotrophicus]
MTGSQAQAFVNRYQVIDHRPNDHTGFSATLLLDTQTGQYTLSFRSTEYSLERNGGDFQRDTVGADTGINDEGFAFAQIDSMQRYWEELTADGGVLAGGQRINVTGYSLGGHLATVFTELHSERVLHTYVFNSPGRGLYSDGTLEEMFAYYREVLERPYLAYSELTGAGADPSDSDLTRYTNLYLAADALEGQPFADTDNIYDDPRYQLAVEAVSIRFNTQSSLWDGVLDLLVGTDGALSAEADSLITHVYGHARNGDVEIVANSNIHPTDSNAVYVEDQPNYQGFLGHQPIYPDWLNEWIAGHGDFGDTHGMALLVDSLALMGAFQSLDPNIDVSKINGSIDVS